VKETDWGGPYLAAAFLCEKVLEEKDGVNSAIRIDDRFDADIVLEDTDSPLPPLPVSLVLYLSFKSGQARGSYPLTLAMEPPSGISSQQETRSIFFESGEDRGAVVVAPLDLRLTVEGLYWFDVHLGERLVTRIPLRIVVQRIVRRQKSGA
jgi:hypothetical protein